MLLIYVFTVSYILPLFSSVRFLLIKIVHSKTLAVTPVAASDIFCLSHLLIASSFLVLDSISCFVQ